MKKTDLLFGMSVLLGLCLSGQALVADTTIFTDGFESYAPNNATVSFSGLDQNLVNGPNASANGTGTNPWVGQGTTTIQNSNIRTGNWWGIPSHTGSNFMMGHYYKTPGNTFINLAHRFGNGLPLTGNFEVDWWVRDPCGKCSYNYCTDFVMLGYYDNMPGDADFNENTSVNAQTYNDANMHQSLCLGMMDAWGSGSADYGAYEARVYGPSILRNYCTNLQHQSGMWNLPVNRSCYVWLSDPKVAGYQHMRILVGPQLADKTNTVAFFVNDMDHAALVSNSQTPCDGYNVLDFVTYNNYKKWQSSSNCTAYYDDVSITKIDPACTIDKVKDAAAGTLVSADGVYVTSIGGSLPNDYAYVQSADRSSGIKIHYNNPYDSLITNVNAQHYSGLTEIYNAGLVGVGTKICTMGRLVVPTDGSDKYIDAYAVYPVIDATPVTDDTGAITSYTPYIVASQQSPVGMNNRDALTDLAQGKYIKTWGKVSNVSGSDFTISDGSQQTIHVSNGTTEVVSEGETITACGVMGKDASGAVMYASNIAHE